MSPIERITLFKVSSEEGIEGLNKRYKTLMQDALKVRCDISFMGPGSHAPNLKQRQQSPN